MDGVNPDYGTKHRFSRSELEFCADGGLFGSGNAQLPAAPLLMIDRVVEIQADGGEYGRGYACAELDIHPGKWFFQHHFRGDPVMPGCFMIEALWQLTGFHLAWSGYPGKGRVLESGRTRFAEPIDTLEQTLKISIHVRKLLMNGNPVCIANGEVHSSGSLKCKSDSLKIGLFS